MKFSVIVPVRLAAARLPRKPLAEIGGVPMVVRVLQRAAASGAARVVAACEEEELAVAVRAAGFEAVRTRGAHTSGSSRVAEAAATLGLGEDDMVVNMQGDEPFLEPQVVAETAQLAAEVECACATPHRQAHADELHDTGAVKVVMDAQGFAAYFSRACIPHRRDLEFVGAGGVDGDDVEGVEAGVRIHIGVYAYRLGELQRVLAAPPAPTEQAEQLEQLRILWHGGRIALHACESASFGVDTEADLARAQKRAAKEAEGGAR